MTRRDPSIEMQPQFSLQPFLSSSALECGFTRSWSNTYVCSYTSVRSCAYLYEHMFPRSTPSPLTRRARNALSLACSFLLLEDDYDVDWEVDQDDPGQDRSKIDGLSDRPARERAAVHHPHRRALRGRSARVRTGQPAQPTQVCLCPVERSSVGRPSSAAVRHITLIRTGRPWAARQ